MFVHLGTPAIAQAHFDHYGLSDVERVHDPQAKLYQARGVWIDADESVSHFFNPKVLAGWFVKGVAFKNGFGKIEGDGEQMPGVFVLRVWRGGEPVRAQDDCGPAGLSGDGELRVT